MRRQLIFLQIRLLPQAVQMFLLVFSKTAARRLVTLAEAACLARQMICLGAVAAARVNLNQKDLAVLLQNSLRLAKQIWRFRLTLWRAKIQTCFRCGLDLGFSS